MATLLKLSKYILTIEYYLFFQTRLLFCLQHQYNVNFSKIYSVLSINSIKNKNSL